MGVEGLDKRWVGLGGSRWGLVQVGGFWMKVENSGWRWDLKLEEG